MLHGFVLSLNEALGTGNIAVEFLSCCFASISINHNVGFSYEDIIFRFDPTAPPFPLLLPFPSYDLPKLRLYHISIQSSIRKKTECPTLSLYSLIKTNPYVEPFEYSIP